MAEYENRVRSAGATGAVAIDEGLRAYMLRVYNYMLMGLALSGATAWIALNTPLGALFFAQTATGFSLSPLGWIVFLALSAAVIAAGDVALLEPYMVSIDGRTTPRDLDYRLSEGERVLIMSSLVGG